MHTLACPRTIQAQECVAIKPLASITVAVTMALAPFAAFAGDPSPTAPIAPATAVEATFEPPFTGDFGCLTQAANGDFRRFDRCGRGDGEGRPVFRVSVLRRLLYGEDGPGTVGRDIAVIRPDGAHWYYVRRDGKSAPALTMDNWPDGFADGPARSPRGMKVGYVDERLDLVIPARFDGAFPFSGGWAVVCLQCLGASDGTHHWYVGGLWGCIDPRGREQAPFHPYVEGGPFETCGRTD